MGFWTFYFLGLVAAWLISVIVWKWPEAPKAIEWKVPAGAERYTWFERFPEFLQSGEYLEPAQFSEKASAGNWRTHLVGGVHALGLELRLRLENESSGHRYHTEFVYEVVPEWSFIFGIDASRYQALDGNTLLRLYPKRRFAALAVIGLLGTAVWNVIGATIGLRVFLASF